MNGASNRFERSFDYETAMDLQTIEQEIAQLWHPDSRGDDPITSLATRASVLNLIVVTPDQESTDHAQDVAERLSKIHPCRVILFHQTLATGRRPVPDIHATCEAGGDEPSVPCIERIRIPVSRQMYPQLSALVQPLIIPELPAYLWWLGQPDTADPTFIAMARASNLTILDSLNFDSTNDLSSIFELEGQLPVRSSIADVNWQRLQPWRELTAQCFDIRSIQWSLSCIREVEIDAGQINGRALPVQSLLLTAWLAHCLGWQPFEARRTRDDRWYIGMYDQHGEHVRIILRSRPSEPAWAGHMLSMSMSAQNSQGEQSSITLSRSRESSLIRMNARTGLANTLHHAVHHPLLPDEALLVPILETTTRDHLFDSSLERAVEIMDLFGKPEAT